MNVEKNCSVKIKTVLGAKLLAIRNRAIAKGLKLLTKEEILMRDEIEDADNRAAVRLAKTPIAVGAYYDRRNGRVVIDLSTGFSIMFAPFSVKGFEKLEFNKLEDQLSKIIISPSGFGIWFPEIDVDIYLPALLEQVCTVG